MHWEPEQTTRFSASVAEFSGTGGGAQLLVERIADAHLRYGAPRHRTAAERPNVAAGITGNASYTVGSATTRFSHFFEESVGSGHIALSMRQDYRQHLAMAARDLGVKYVRGHGLLDDDMSVSLSNGRQSFYNVDSFVDFLLSIGMRPLFELSFMPSWLANGTTTVCHYHGNNNPPHNYTQWQELIHALGAHMVERYGAATASEFRWEVWNEPNDHFWSGSQAEYFQLYQHAAWGLKNASAALQVGGPATCCATCWLTDFTDFVNASALPADFVSSHDYSSCGMKGLGVVSNVVDNIGAGRALIGDDVAWLITEYGASCTQGIGDWSADHAYHDMIDQASYTMAVMDRVANQAGSTPGPREPQALSYWAFSDVFEEEFFPVNNESFHGMFGLINLHGVPKPTYRAYQLLHETGNTRLAVTGPPPSPLGKCGAVDNATDLFGNDLRIVENVTTVNECCSLCISNEACAFYTLWTDDRRCGLKSGANRTTNPHRTSGSVIRPPQTADSLCSANTGVIAVVNGTSYIDIIVYNHAVSRRPGHPDAF